MKNLLYIFILPFWALTAVAQENPSNPIPSVEIMGAPMSGVVYFEAPANYQGNWRTSPYQRGSLGNAFEAASHFSIFTLDASRVAFNQNPADVNNQPNPDGTTKQENRWSMEFNTVDLKLGQLHPKFLNSFFDGTQYGINFKNQYEIRDPKYVRDVDNRGINTSQPIRDDFGDASADAYLKKEWIPNLNWSKRLDLAVTAAIEASPLSVMGVYRDRDIENFKPSQSVTSVAYGIHGQASLVILLKIKNTKGQEKWLVAVSALQAHDESLGRQSIAYDQLVFQGQIDYRLTHRLSMGIRIQEDKESVMSSVVNTKYYEVDNIAGLVARWNLR